MPTITQTPFGVYHSNDCSSGRDMLKACGGDFTIEKVQVAYPWIDRSGTPDGIDSDGNPVYPVRQIPIAAHAAVRSDTGDAVADSTVGDGYVVLQNSEMVDICDAICGQRKMNYEFMTVLEGGRGLAIQVDCPELADALNVGGDKSRARLTLTDWHDGTGSLRLHFSMLRLMCRNQLPALGKEFARNRRRNRFGFYSIKHTKNMADRIVEAVKIIKDAVGDITDTAEILRLLADVKCTRGKRQDFFRQIANPEGKDEREMSKRAKGLYESRLKLLEGAAKMDCNRVEGHGESWYETLQAVTYYGTHLQTVRGGEEKSAEEKRFQAANFGSGALTNIRGMQLALEMSGLSDKI